MNTLARHSILQLWKLKQEDCYELRPAWAVILYCETVSDQPTDKKHLIHLLCQTPQLSNTAHCPMLVVYHGTVTDLKLWLVAAGHHTTEWYHILLAQEKRKIQFLLGSCCFSTAIRYKTL